MGSRSIVSSVGVTTSAIVRSTPCSYHGYTFRSGVTATVVTIYDNASAASGTILEVINIPASSSVSAYYSVEDAAGGVRALNGIYFSTDNAVTGSVRVAN